MADPPSYFPPSDSPAYSTEPGPLEQRLALASQSSFEPSTSTAILRRSGSGIAVALKNQDETAEIPTYSRRMAITGEITLESTQGIASVLVMVK
jgi:hypothetical protein